MDSGEEACREAVVSSGDAAALRRQNMRSIALRSRQSAGEKHGFQRWFVFGGMLGVTPAASTCRRMALPS